MKYISHLDLNRCMGRALRRSGIPVWYTQGFTPHAYVTFALPLSLGHESLCEAMDFRLTDGAGAETDGGAEESATTKISDGELIRVKELLAAQMPPGLEITDIYTPVMKYGDIAFAHYRVVLTVSLSGGRNLPDALGALFEEPVFIEKTTKHGTRQINVTTYYREATVHIADNTVGIDAMLPAGSVENINPGCFAQALREKLGADVTGESVMRLDLYNAAREPFR